MTTKNTSTCSAIVTDKSPTYRSELIQKSIPELSDGEVLIRSHYSSINYKDALAITGKGKILKNFPLTPGIDVSGTVEQSRSDQFSVGDSVLVTGCGLGEWRDGGFSEFVTAPENWVIPLPNGLDLKEAMILGTAGFTAALCLARMQQMDQTPDKGPIAITGASGGVGSIATQIFSKAGFDVVAISGKISFHDQLKKWGASRAVTPKDLHLGVRPLEPSQFGGAVDNVGGDLLAGLCRHIGLWGNIACVGLASSHELHTTVMPMILRGVSLLGISSANCPDELRRKIWKNLGKDWKPPFLKDILQMEIPLEEVFSASQQMIEQKTTGRIVIRLRD